MWTFPITLASVIRGDQAVGEGFCRFSGFVDNVVILVSVWTLAASSVVRFLHITRPKVPKTCNQAAVARITLLIWGSSVLVAGMPLLGWDEYVFSPLTFSCSIRGLPGLHRYYFLFFCIIAFPGPFLLMTFSYSQIFVRMCTVQNTTRKQTMRQVRASIILLIIIVLFTLSTLPTFIVALMFWSRMRLDIPIQVPIVLHWLLQSNASLNPLIYSLLNSQYRAMWVEYVSHYKHVIVQRRSIGRDDRAVRVRMRPLLRQNAKHIPTAHMKISRLTIAKKMTPAAKVVTGREPESNKDR